ncbi:MAG: hypothetical protein CMM96_00235 [Rickettsiales bacterium]|nr:hypothetical protein [Rickettsiales bacterium]
MSIGKSREALRKSSIGIDSIRNSITGLAEGLISIGKKSSELLKQTRQTNLFKSKLISQDAEFFRKRRENVLRKQREDELEASSITGVTKKEGNLIQRSTKGFLGRILDFIGTLILGWALVNLPKIIEMFQKLFGYIKRVVNIFTKFMDGMKNFFNTLGEGVDGFLNIIKRFDFKEDDKKIRETFDKTEQNLVRLNKDFVESIQSFNRDKDLALADQIANDLENSDTEENLDEENNKEQEKINKKDSIESIEKRANGGDVEKGVPYITGERGPELFVPDQSGTIVPNDELVENIEGMDMTDDDLIVDNVETEEEDDSNIDAMNSMIASIQKMLDLDQRPKKQEPSTEMLDGISINMPQVSPKAEEIITPRSDDKSIMVKKKQSINLRGNKRKAKNTIIIAKNQTQSSNISSVPKRQRVFMMNSGESKQKILTSLQSISSLKYT